MAVLLTFLFLLAAFSHGSLNAVGYYGYYLARKGFQAFAVIAYIFGHSSRDPEDKSIVSLFAMNT